MEGIFVAYVSATEGYSAIMFVFRNNRITGADIGGMKYRGSYESKNELVSGVLQATLPANTASITGFQAGSDDVSFEVPFAIQMDNINEGAITISSPLGEVNAAIHKLQELP